jgi:hypothetical protein
VRKLAFPSLILGFGLATGVAAVAAAISVTIIGTPKADVIVGSAGPDRLYGKAGADKLYGRGGNDVLVGGSGADLLSCGLGRDTAFADSKDRIIGCEVVHGLGPPPPPQPKPPPPPPPGSTRANPLPLGQTVGISVRNGEEMWRLRILSVDFDAWPEIQAENQFNRAPAPGFQYVMAAVEVTYVSGQSPRRPWSSIASDLNTVGASNVAFNQYDNGGCGVVPDDFVLKDTDVFPPGSLTGNVCWPVRSSDVPTLEAYLTFTAGPYWMALR